LADCERRVEAREWAGVLGDWFIQCAAEAEIPRVECLLGCRSYPNRLYENIALDETTCKKIYLIYINLWNTH
jgi:hypothetical protein